MCVKLLPPQAKSMRSGESKSILWFVVCRLSGLLSLMVEKCCRLQCSLWHQVWARNEHTCATIDKNADLCHKHACMLVGVVAVALLCHNAHYAQDHN